MSDRVNAKESASAVKVPNGMTAIAIPRNALEVIAGKFPQGVTVLVVPPSALQPEFIRLPKNGETCSVTGLKRTSLIELLQHAGRKVKTSYLRKPGATQGITLIHRQSLVDYIELLPARDWADSDGDNQ